MSTTAPLHLLTLPAEIRDKIWDFLISSTIDEADSKSKRYHLCLKRRSIDRSTQSVLGWDGTECWARVGRRQQELLLLGLRYLSEEGRQWGAPIEAGCNSRGVEMWEVLHTDPYIIASPLVEYFLVDKQVKGEVMAAIRRLAPDGRYLRVQCCCKESEDEVTKEQPTVQASQIGYVPNRRFGDGIFGP